MSVVGMVAHELPLDEGSGHTDSLYFVVAKDPEMLRRVSSFQQEHNHCSHWAGLGYRSESLILWCDHHRELIIIAMERG